MFPADFADYRRKKTTEFACHNSLYFIALHHAENPLKSM